MGSDFRDVDDDGLPDIAFLALQNETFPLFRNTGKGFFDDVAPPSGLAALARSMSGYSVGLYDFDNDGWKDLFVSCGHVQSVPVASTMQIEQHNAVFRNVAGRWTALVGEAGLAAQPARRHRGAAFANFDGDGRLDVVVTALGAPMEIWLNRSATANHWLDLDLTGAGFNRDGVGAKVTVTTPDGKQYNHATSAVGYASSSAVPVHFGLGRRDVAMTIDIQWPDGRIQRLTDVKAVVFLRKQLSRNAPVLVFFLPAQNVANHLPICAPGGRHGFAGLNDLFRIG